MYRPARKKRSDLNREVGLVSQDELDCLLLQLQQLVLRTLSFRKAVKSTSCGPPNIVVLAVADGLLIGLYGSEVCFQVA